MNKVTSDLEIVKMLGFVIAGVSRSIRYTCFSILPALLIIESVARVSQHVLFTHELLVKQVKR